MNLNHVESNILPGVGSPQRNVVWTTFCPPIIQCSGSPALEEVLKQCLPPALQSDPSLKRLAEPISNCLEEDQMTKRWLVSLVTSLGYR